MLEFKGEYDLIEYLKTQDLNTNGVGLGVTGKKLLDGYLTSPYEISGYLYDKETLSFPIGERFKIKALWGNREDAERSIKRIREAVGDI